MTAQDGRGLDPLGAGLVFTILAAAYLGASLSAPVLTLRFGRDLISVGALILAAGDGVLLAAVAYEGTGGPVGLLAPGLALVGAGQGLCITPLTTTVLSHTDPQRAGAVSGALSTMQQVGNAVGVAVTGLVFLGALGGGYAGAFARSLLQLACRAVAVAVLTRLLPGRRMSVHERDPAVRGAPPDRSAVARAADAISTRGTERAPSPARDPRSTPRQWRLPDSGGAWTTPRTTARAQVCTSPAGRHARGPLPRSGCRRCAGTRHFA